MDDAKATQVSAPSTNSGKTLGSQTLRRGLKAIKLLAAHPEGLRLQDVAKLLNVNRNAAYRVLVTLTEEGFATRHRDDTYRLGLKLMELSSQVMPGLRERIRPALVELAEELGATTTLTIADGDDAVAIEVVEPRSTIMHVAYRVRHRNPVPTASHTDRSAGSRFRTAARLE
jgi:DNA-binding IclR family transcriptional regulator